MLSIRTRIRRTAAVSLAAAAALGGLVAATAAPASAATPGSYFYAEGTVTYQDVATNATVTFSGRADSLIHDSHTFANTTGGMSVSGKQGYYGGITPHINVTYTLS